MVITTYLNDFLNNFKTLYSDYDTVKTSIGITQTLDQKKSLNNLPAIIVENISFDSDTQLLTTSGTLYFDVYYIDIDKNANGYAKLEEDFLDNFVEYIKTLTNEVTIEGVVFEMSDEGDEFSVIVSCEAVIVL